MSRFSTDFMTTRRLDKETAGKRELGFSLLEVLIAGLLLLIILLGIVPLFVRAGVNNIQGNDSTTISHFAKSQVEQLYQLPFNHPNSSVPIGSTERETIEYWAPESEEWQATQPSEAFFQWRRTSRVRQYNIFDVEDGALDTPLDGGTDERAIHLKEIEIEIDSLRTAGALGSGKTITLRTLKAF